MKYIFIDTNLFIDAVTSNYSDNILNSILKQLDKKTAKVILPEVIKVEMLTQYSYWKKDAIENITNNLTINKILGIDELTDSQAKGEKKKKQKIKTEAEKLGIVIDSDRQKMIKKAQKYYESISKKIEQIFKHENAENIPLTDPILLAGMRRSLLKKSPYTRTDKANENPHTRDVDCIAFEAVLEFCNKQSGEQKQIPLIMCVNETDYLSSDGKLRGDLIKDIKLENKCYKTVLEMLDKEFNIKIGPKKSKETTFGSLAGNGETLIENSKLIM